MSDAELDEVVAMLREQGRAGHIRSMERCVVVGGIALLLLHNDQLFPGVLLGVFCIVTYLIRYLKIASIDGHKYAPRLAERIPYWERPLPRRADTLREIREDEL